MRKIIFSLLIIPLFVGCSAMGVRIDSPLIRQVTGARFDEKIEVEVGHSSDYFAKTFIYDKEVGVAYPNQVLRGEKFFEPHAPQIPVVMLFYRTPECRAEDYVGYAWTVIQISYNNYYPQYGSRPRAKEKHRWIASERDVNFLRKRPPVETTASYPLEKKIKIPRVLLSSTTVVPVVNNSPRSVDVFLVKETYGYGKGIYKSFRENIGVGGLYYLEARNPSGYYSRESLSLELVYASGKTEKHPIQIPYNGIWARPIIAE